MSARIDPRFEDALRALAARLDMPQPARSRALLEIAGDLEDTYQHYRGQGLQEHAALDAALERFDLSDDAVAELGAVHSTWARRFMDSLSERGRDRFERVGLSLVLLVMATLVWRRLAGGGLLEHIGAAALPSILFTLVGLATAARKAWQFWLTADHRAQRLHRGLPEILIAAAAALVCGMAGYWLEIHATLRDAQTATSTTGSDLVPGLFGGLQSAFATANAGMIGAILGFLAWWLLARKAARIEQAETEYLIDFDPHPDSPAGAHPRRQ